MVRASFLCRNPLGLTLRDRIELWPTASGRVAITASRNDGAEVISVHLSPEDILEFATEALRLADEIASRELP